MKIEKMEQYLDDISEGTDFSFTVEQNGKKLNYICRG